VCSAVSGVQGGCGGPCTCVLLCVECREGVGSCACVQLWCAGRVFGDCMQLCAMCDDDVCSCECVQLWV
jgi:hypothetical protein